MFMYTIGQLILQHAFLEVCNNNDIIPIKKKLKYKQKTLIMYLKTI